MDKQEVFYFQLWYKNEFSFKSKDGKLLSFVPYYRSYIGTEITIEKVISEGCEEITVDGIAVKGNND